MSDKITGYLVSSIDTGRQVIKSMSAPLLVKAAEVAAEVAQPAGLKEHTVSGKTVYRRVFNPAMLHLAVAANTYNARAINAKVRSAISGGFSITGDPTEKDRIGMVKALNSLARRFDSDFMEFLSTVLSDAEEYGTGLAVLFNTAGDKPGTLDYVPGEAVYKLWRPDDKKDAAFAWVHKLDSQKTAVYREFDSKNAAPGEVAFAQAVPVIRRSSLDRIYGAPDFIPAFQAIALATLIDEFNLGWFSNQAMPEYAVVITGDPPEDFKENIETYFSRAIKGTHGKTLVLEIPAGAKIEFKKLTADIKEASFKLQRKDCRDEIISAHSVPPIVMGIVETGALGGNVGQEQLKPYKSNVVDPLQNKLNRLGSRLLARINGSDKYGIKLNPFDAEDEKVNAETDNTDITSGAATINEVRARRGRAPADDPNADIPKPLWVVPALPPVVEPATVKALAEVNAELRKYVVQGGAE